MGHRASLVLRENGETDVRYSHWGARHLIDEIFYGPAAAREYVECQDEDRLGEVLDATWGEGAAVLDFDRRVLLFWGDHDLLGDVPARVPHLLEMMRHTWPGWSVRWASRGMHTVKEYLDSTPPPADEPIPPGPLDEHAASFVRDHTAWWLEFDVGGYVDTVVTVRRHDGTLADHTTTHSLERTLSLGEGLLEILAGRTPVSPPPEREVQSTLLVDEAARELHAWWGYSLLEDPLGWTSQRWPGWRFHWHEEDGYAGHLRRTGRDPAPLLLPREEAVRDLLDYLRRNVDAEARAEELRGWVEETTAEMRERFAPDTVEVHPAIVPRWIGEYLDGGAPLTEEAKLRILAHVEAVMLGQARTE